MLATLKDATFDTGLLKAFQLGDKPDHVNSLIQKVILQCSICYSTALLQLQFCHPKKAIRIRNSPSHVFEIHAHYNHPHM